MRRCHPCSFLIGSVLVVGAAPLALGAPAATEALAGAAVADPSLTAATLLNPALMAFHDGTWVEVGGTWSWPQVEYVHPAGGATDSQTATPRFTPEGALFRTGSTFSAGLMFTRPTQGATDWAAGTFNAGGSAAPLVSEWVIDDLRPALTWHRGGVAIGIEADVLRVETLHLTTPAEDFAASGFHTGFGLSLAYQGRGWSAGAHYRSAVDVPLIGVANGASAALTLPVPWTFAVGVGHTLGSRARWEFDWTRTGYDRLGTLTATQGGAPLWTAVLGWRAANTYALGLTETLDGGVTARAGFSLAEPYQPDSGYTAGAPDALARSVGIGASQAMGDWTLDTSLHYVWMNERVIASTTSPGGGSLIGTSAFNGLYRQHALAVGVDFTRHF